MPKGKDLISHKYNGVVIYQQRDDGFINATAMCVAFDKNVVDWLKTEPTYELAVVLARRLGIKPKYDLNHKSFKTRPWKRIPSLFPLLVIVRGGSPENGGGTWIHYKLGIPLAQWLSAEFSLTVSDWVEEWLLTGKNPIHADDLKRIHLRRQLKDQDRLYLTDQLKAYLEKRGEYSSVNPHRLFSQIHDAINRVITGETSKQMYQRTGLKSHQLLRDYFPLEKLNHYSALTICIANHILAGHNPIEAVHLAANQVLPPYFKAEPVELVDPIKALEQQLLERLLPPKKH
jgi:hypothetical protein